MYSSLSFSQSVDARTGFAAFFHKRGTLGLG
jgi:hypothetical protein